MRFTAIVSAVTAATLGFSSLAFADDEVRRGRGQEQRPQRIEQRDNYRPGEARHDAREARRDIGEARRDLREGRRDLREARNDRWDNRRDGRWDNRHGHREARHSRHDHRIYSGGYIPYEYRAPRYVVNDWQTRHLYAPPYGHHWVQAGNDYVLVAIATGLIASLLLSQY